MTVLHRALACIGVLALGLGGALVVAAPASAVNADIEVSSTSSDILVANSFPWAVEKANNDAGADRIVFAAGLVGPLHLDGIPEIVDDLDVVGPTGGITIETTDTNPLGRFTISNAAVTMSDIDVRPNLGGIDAGFFAVDSDLTLTRVTVSGFDSGVAALDSTLAATDVELVDNVSLGLYFVDTVGTNDAVLTGVTLGGHAGANSQVGALVYGSGGVVSLTDVTASFLDGFGLELASDVGSMTLDTVTTDDVGTGIELAASGGSVVTAQHIAINRTTATAFVIDNLDDAQLHATDVNVDDSMGDGIELYADNGSLATFAASTVTGSASSGFYVEANDGTVEISGSTASGNGLGGGCGCGSGSGFELYADDSTVTLDGVRASGNTATDGAGVAARAIAGSAVAISGSTISDNTAAGGYGGGIDLADVEDAGTTVTITGTTVSGNSAAFGGGISVTNVLNGATVTVTGATVITDNHATDDGGGIIVDTVADDGSTFTLSDSTVTLNTSGDFGAGVYLLDVGDATASTAKATIVRTTIDSNTAAGYGAGIAINDPGVEATGQPTVLIDSSTLSNNSTVAGGGGIYITKFAGSPSVVKLLNTTVSANTAQLGGGVHVEVGGGAGGADLTTIISSSTIAGNVAHTSAGIETGGGGTNSGLQVENSILADNTSDTADPAVSDLQVQSGAPFSMTYSLVQKPNAAIVVPSGVGNLTGVSPKLGPLANNGGTTKTMLVAPGSPAYNAGNPAFVGAGLLDQRGLARVYQVIDLGAVEWHPELAHTGSSAPQPEPPLIALLLLLTGTAMVAFSRLRMLRAAV